MPGLTNQTVDISLLLAATEEAETAAVKRGVVHMSILEQTLSYLRRILAQLELVTGDVIKKQDVRDDGGTE